MRRRERLEPANDVDVPADLRSCVVGDWVGPTELVSDRTVTAWCRWRRARLAWLEERRVPREQQCEVIPFSKPRWGRDPRS